MPPRPPHSLRPLVRPLPPRIRPQFRLQSSIPKPSPPGPPNPSAQTRSTRILNNLPKFMHPWTNGLRSAPLSHISSFLILHELTAIVPLLGLATLFHYTSFLPQSWAEGRWVKEGVEKFGRYFGRKGWFGFEREDKTAQPVENVATIIGTENALGTERKGGAKDEEGENIGAGEREKGIEERWHVGQKGSRILVEVATAYAITKVFLPARIVLSVWMTPWFARAVVGRFTGIFGKKGASAVGKGAETVTKKMP